MQQQARLSPTRADDAIEKRCWPKRLILLRNRFAEISNTSRLFPFPEEEKRIDFQNWAGKTGPEILTTSSVKCLEKPLPEPHWQDIDKGPSQTKGWWLPFVLWFKVKLLISLDNCQVNWKWAENDCKCVDDTVCHLRVKPASWLQALLLPTCANCLYSSCNTCLVIANDCGCFLAMIRIAIAGQQVECALTYLLIPQSSFQSLIMSWWIVYSQFWLCSVILWFLRVGSFGQSGLQ